MIGRIENICNIYSLKFIRQINHFHEDFKFLTFPLYSYKADGCGGAGIWSMYNRQCYQCITAAVSWQTARSSCQQLGADLVTISNAGTQTFVKSTTFYNLHSEPLL